MRGAGFVSDLYASADGATPIDDGVAAGLKVDWISTRGELNAAEQENILKATTWAFNRRKRWTVTEIADGATLKRLHRRMLGDVWKWAGQLRQIEVNIGPPWWMVPTQLEDLCVDLAVQAADAANLAWPAPELAVRFHHRLVAIHPFPNGNGRHARLCADLIVRALGAQPLTWGGRLTDENQARDIYIAALQHADRESDFGPLLAFSQS
jgi:Fic-DOC domain mobile mystery protein B